MMDDSGNKMTEIYIIKKTNCDFESIVAYVFGTIGCLMFLSSIPLLIIFNDDDLFKDISIVMLVVGFILCCICGCCQTCNTYEKMNSEYRTRERV